jgi:predicted PurR-regulated permease PerM
MTGGHMDPGADPAPPSAPPQPTTPILSDSRRNATEAVTWPVRVATAWTWRLLVLAAAGYVVFRVSTRVEWVLLAVIIALFLTAVLQPLQRLYQRFFPRPKSLSPLLALLSGVIVLGGIAYFVVWQITTHATQLGNQLSNLVTRTKHWLQTGPVHMNTADLNKLTTRITDAITGHPGQLISGAITTVRTVAEGIAALLLILLITFYLLRDGPIVWQWVVRLFPRSAHARVDNAGRAGWGAFGGYMRGQLLIALIHGVSITIVLLVMRVSLAAPLGVLIFLGSFIPLVGLTITGAIAVGFALLEHGWVTALVVTVAIVVLVQIEGHLLQPFIQSRTVHLHPLAVVLAVVTGTTLGGIPGALIAVPLVSFVNTSVRALRAGPEESAPRDRSPVDDTSVAEDDTPR